MEKSAPTNLVVLEDDQNLFPRLLPPLPDCPHRQPGRI